MRTLKLDKFSITRPTPWSPDLVKLEIQDYDFDSTQITIEQLKELGDFIKEVLDEYSDQNKKHS